FFLLFNSQLKCPTTDDGSEIFFHIIDAQGKRKLIELAAAAYSGSFLFGYNTEMDVTVTSIFSESRDISTILLMPGQQGGVLEKNSLLSLENDIFTHNFPSKIKLLETKLKPHLSSILLIPHLNQQSFVNISDQLHQLGLGELFNSESSNLRGIQETTAAPIHLSEVLLINRVSLCNADRKQRLSDRYPSLMDLKSNLSKYIESTQSAKDHDAMIYNENVLKLDKPFLYIIRHNPSQLILYVGRFNPVKVNYS
ncbi:ovalbumin-like, partial [Ochlerotatus camptorhynchus]|uniref:ovalbumin-like n=1 Tax=Ochlerotatus camptorhynchus TaxID=644619 RepID=UPI0031D8B91C